MSGSDARAGHAKTLGAPMHRPDTHGQAALGSERGTAMVRNETPWL